VKKLQESGISLHCRIRKRNFINIVQESEISCLLRAYNPVEMRSLLIWDFTQRRLVVSCLHFRLFFRDQAVKEERC